nr:integrase, catalytic region, zinc finger, CCHC-type, peptidase aspartic, catalytic [Tanacetum cinerariifolium]
MLIFSRAPLFLWAEAIATAKPDILFLYVFGALCYPKNDREEIRKLGAKGDIGFFIGYSADSCAYIIYNRRTTKIIETMNVSFDELSAMAFEQRSSKLGLQSMTSGQISSELNLTYAPSTITKQQPTEGELDLLFEAMYDDYFGGQPSATVENVPPVQEPDDVDELNPNAMIDGNAFVNPFATSFSNAAETSSSQNVEPSNMHTFYQPYPHEFQWTKDHPLEKVIGEPSRPVLTRNQLRSDGDMCIYALTKLETENVELEFPDSVCLTPTFSFPSGMKPPRMFRINPSKTSREEKQVPNTVSASAKTKPITVSQPHVITKKDVNSDLSGLSFIGVDNTKTRRPQPRSNTKHD